MSWTNDRKTKIEAVNDMYIHIKTKIIAFLLSVTNFGVAMWVYTMGSCGRVSVKHLSVGVLIVAIIFLFLYWVYKDSNG